METEAYKLLMETVTYKPKNASFFYFNSLAFVKMNFSRGVGGSLSHLWKFWRGGGLISSLQKWKIQGGGGVLSEIPSAVGV